MLTNLTSTLSSCNDGSSSFDTDSINEQINTIFDSIPINPYYILYSFALVIMNIVTISIIIYSLKYTPLKISYGCCQVFTWFSASVCFFIAFLLVQVDDLSVSIVKNGTDVLGNNTCFQNLGEDRLEICNMITKCVDSPQQYAVPYLFGYENLTDLLLGDDTFGEFLSPNATVAQVNVLSEILLDETGSSAFDVITDESSSSTVTSGDFLSLIDGNIVPNLSILSPQPTEVNIWIENSRSELSVSDNLNRTEIGQIFDRNRPPSLANATINELFPFLDSSTFGVDRRRLSESCQISTSTGVVRDFKCIIIDNLYQSTKTTLIHNSLFVYTILCYISVIIQFILMAMSINRYKIKLVKEKKKKRTRPYELNF